MAASDFPEEDFETTLRNPKVTSPNQKAFIQRNTSIAGYTVSRRRATKVQKQWKCTWAENNVLNSTERGLIETHHDAYAGGSFAWKHPETEATHTVTYVTDTLEFTPIQHNAGYYGLELVFQEV